MIEVNLPSGVAARLDMIPSEVSKLTFVAAFLDDKQMRRPFTGTQSQAVCDELGLPIGRNEADNCRAIAAYYAGGEDV